MNPLPDTALTTIELCGLQVNCTLTVPALDCAQYRDGREVLQYGTGQQEVTAPPARMSVPRPRSATRTGRGR